MINKHPKAERFGLMAEKFRAIHRDIEVNPVVDFVESELCRHECATIACHGGWAGYALKLPYSQKGWDSKLDFFERGATVLAVYLFADQEAKYGDLCAWAVSYPELWDNLHGGLMFGSDGYRAFGFEYSNKHLCTLDAIANHYDKVKANLEKL